MTKRGIYAGRPTTRVRANNKAGAKHVVNPAGSKFVKMAKKRVWSGRVRMPS